MSYYGIRFNQCPLWNVVVMGGQVWGMMLGWALWRRGGPRRGEVPFGGGRTGQEGSMWEGLAVCPGWGRATALGPTWISANSAITPHSEQLAHKGYSGTCSPSIAHGDPRSSPLVCLNITEAHPGKVVPRTPPRQRRSPHRKVSG